MLIIYVLFLAKMQPLYQAGKVVSPPATHCLHRMIEQAAHSNGINNSSQILKGSRLQSLYANANDITT